MAVFPSWAQQGLGLIGSLELRHQEVTSLIEEYKKYADQPGHQRDQHLAKQGILLRAHVQRLQKPRDLTRNLEKELSQMPTILESKKDFIPPDRRDTDAWTYTLTTLFN